MSQEIRDKGIQFAEFLEGFSEEELQKGNEAEFQRAKEEYERFKSDFANNHCYLCDRSLDSFSKKNPCIHWLLKPKGFKKKDIKLIAEKYGIFQIQSLLRWYANEEAFAKNINDLAEEGSGSKLLELTIKYKNIEWSFSCAESDYLGHQNSQHAKNPHYHFQMRVDKRQFINFNDFHLPLSEMDVLHISAMQAKPDVIKNRNSFGEGMADVFNEEMIEHVLNSPSFGDNHEEAPFSIDSFVIAEEGKTISGDDLYDVIEEAKAKGVTVASLLHKVPNAKTEITVSPGPGVVEQSPRSRGKKGT